MLPGIPSRRTPARAGGFSRWCRRRGAIPPCNLPPMFSSRAGRFFKPWPSLSERAVETFSVISDLDFQSSPSANAMRNSTSVASAWRTMLFSASFTAISKSCRKRPSSVTGGKATGTLKRQEILVCGKEFVRVSAQIIGQRLQRIVLRVHRPDDDIQRRDQAPRALRRWPRNKLA